MYSGQRDVDELLLAAGDDLNATDTDGTTPQHLVADEGQTAVVDELLLNKVGAEDAHSFIIEIVVYENSICNCVRNQQYSDS